MQSSELAKTEMNTDRLRVIARVLLAFEIGTVRIRLASTKKRLLEQAGNLPPEEVEAAFEEVYRNKRTYDDFGDPEGASYVDVFFRGRDGEWTLWLDTADREGLADAVEQLRGNPPLPTYSDLGGTLLNKVMVNHQ